MKYKQFLDKINTTIDALKSELEPSDTESNTQPEPTNTDSSAELETQPVETTE